MREAVSFQARSDIYEAREPSIATGSEVFVLNCLNGLRGLADLKNIVSDSAVSTLNPDTSDL